MLYSSIDALIESSYHYVTSCSGQPAAAFLALCSPPEKHHVCLAGADLYYQAVLSCSDLLQGYKRSEGGGRVGGKVKTR